MTSHTHPPHKEELPLEDELRQIYSEENGDLPDFSALETPTRSWRRLGLLVAGVILFLTASIWTGFFLFGGASFGTSDEIEIEIVTEKAGTSEEGLAPVSGAPAHIAIRYRNISRTPIASLSLRVNLPEAFLVDRRLPDPTDKGNVWELGYLSPGSDGLVELYGTFLSEVPAIEKIQVIATYRPANFSSDFDRILSKDIVIEESSATLTVTSPDEATPGEPFSLTYELSNATTDGLSNLRLRALVPEGFRVFESEPPIEEGLQWNLPRLEAHSKATFHVTGSMPADVRGLQDMGGEVLFLQDGAPRSQGKILHPVTVLGGALSLGVIVNGSSRDQSAELGSVLHVSLPYENASEATRKNVEVSLALTGNGTIPIDWNSDSIVLASGVRKGGTLTWDQDAIESLLALEPNTKNTIDLSFPLLETLTSESASTLTFTATISADATRGGKRIELSSAPVHIRLQSDVKLFTSALYHDQNGTVLGAGPLPPRVGETTTYAIRWSLSGSSLENTAVEASLPDGVTFVSVKGGTGSVSVTPQNSVRWSIGTLEENATTIFLVSVTPTIDDIGSTLSLMEPAVMSARDPENGETLRKEGLVLTSNLHDDSFAEDDGIVVE